MKKYSIANLISILLANVFFLFIFISIQNRTAQFMLLPFFICFLASLWKEILFVMGKEEYTKIFSKIYVLSFFVFWFSFLSIFTYDSIQKQSYSLIPFSIPFWLAGIYFFYQEMIKKKK